MGSARLPGKSMLDICNRPLVGYLIDRLRLCKTLHDIVIATPTSTENDIIEKFCNTESISCFRGSEEDVLGRTHNALQSMSADVGVEGYGDGPLIDPQIVDNIVRYYCKNEFYDFVGNDLKTTYPPGMEVEVFSVEALADSNRRVKKCDPVREHGTLFIRQNSDLYNITNLEAPVDVRRPELELEVDTAEDLEVIRAIACYFDGRKDYTLLEMIQFLDNNQEISAINNRIPRRWKEHRND